MTKLILLFMTVLAGPAHGEINGWNIWSRFRAWGAGKYYSERAETFEPIMRPGRVPLLDVRTCPEPDCVIVAGKKIPLEATPLNLLHGRAKVIGRAHLKESDGVFFIVNLNSWIKTVSDRLLVWASVHGHSVKILGYSVQSDDAPGVENEMLSAVTDVPVYKFLTSENAVEVEIARELVQRKLFCESYPHDPFDLIQDEVSHLESHGLVESDSIESRLVELKAYASLITTETGRQQCDSPISDPVDFVLEKVRADLERLTWKQDKLRPVPPTKVPNQPPVTPELPGAPPVPVS